MLTIKCGNAYHMPQIVIYKINLVLTINYYVYQTHFRYLNEQAKLEIGWFRITLIGHGYKFIKNSLTCDLRYPKH